MAQTIMQKLGDREAKKTLTVLYQDSRTLHIHVLHQSVNLYYTLV